MRGAVGVSGGAVDTAPVVPRLRIGVAYDTHIPLKDHVRLVILPKQYVEDLGHRNSALIAELDALGLIWEPYDWRPNETPALPSVGDIGRRTTHAK